MYALKILEILFQKVLKYIKGAQCKSMGVAYEKICTGKEATHDNWIKEIYRGLCHHDGRILSTADIEVDLWLVYLYRLVKEMNKVNPGILKKNKIKNASGLIDFFTTLERRKKCPSWKRWSENCWPIQK